MRPATINALFAIAAFAAPACAIVDRAFDYTWHAVAPPMEPTWILVSVERLRAVCQRADALACVVRRFDINACLVFSAVPRDELPQFVIDHEEVKHCMEGLNHD